MNYSQQRLHEYGAILEGLLIDNAVSKYWAKRIRFALGKSDYHPAPIDYNQEQAEKIVCIVAVNGYQYTKEHDEIISFTRESDGHYFEKDRTARIVYKDEVQKIGRIDRIYATDQFKSGLGVTIDGNNYNADLVEHIVSLY